MFIDVFFGIVVIFSLYSGFKRGILKTLISVAALIIGFGLAVRLTPPVSNLISGSSEPSALAAVGAFLTVFFGSVLLFGLIARTLEKGLKAVKLNFVNQIAGALLLAAIGVFLFSCLISFVDKAHLISDAAKESSRFYGFIETVPDRGFAVIRTIFPFMKDMWENLIELFNSTAPS